MADSTDALSSPTANKGKWLYFIIFSYKVNLYICCLGTKREADLDDISPTKLKSLKAARNGTNGDVVDDESSNHKNGDEHLQDEEDEDDDDVCLTEWIDFK